MNIDNPKIKQALNALEVRKKKDVVNGYYRRLFESDTNPKLIIDAKGAVIACNDVFCKTYGKTPDEVKGSPIGLITGDIKEIVLSLPQNDKVIAPLNTSKNGYLWGRMELKGVFERGDLKVIQIKFLEHAQG